jgi:hypothetical protein
MFESEDCLFDLQKNLKERIRTLEKLIAEVRESTEDDISYVADKLNILNIQLKQDLKNSKNPY